MLVYSTYCSADKNDSKTLLKAIERYKSDRIMSVYNLAKTKGLKFVILSGLYGIVEPQEPIDYYDHLLSESDIEKHSDLLVEQITEKNISQIVFFTNCVIQDANIKPYIKCIKLAAEKCGISLEIKDYPFIHLNKPK